MTKSALRKLRIEHLRGAMTPFCLDFENGKKLTVVYGENGSGKSTICDALDLLGTGNVGSLDHRGLGNTDRYRASLGRSTSDVSVVLESDTTVRATIGKRSIVVVPAEARPHVEVLRRKQIVSLLETTAGERYKAIQRFVDVSGVETSERNLRTLIKELNASRATAIARVQENEDSIGSHWTTAGKPPPDPIAWAHAESSRDQSSLMAEADALGVLGLSYRALEVYPAKLAAARRLVEAAALRLSTTTTRVAEAEQSAIHGTRETVGVLEAARHYLAKNPTPDSCPLCESSDKVSRLVQRVEERLLVFGKVRDLQSAARNDEGELEKATGRLDALVADARLDAAAFERARAAHLWSESVPLPPSAPPQDADALVEWLVATANLPGDWERTRAERSGRRLFLATLKAALDTWRENVAEQKKLDVLIPALESALVIVTEERRNFTDGILASIASEVGRLYEAVHPGEGLNKISLQLDPTKRASLEIAASFLGESHPPQAYFSDSHLDTLGLCVFLAVAGLDTREQTIMVLDDVLASVDEPHVERLIEMLYVEALNFRHCVITTHYKPWKQKLRWGWLRQGQCQFVELDEWTSARGLTLINAIPENVRLGALLAESPPDVQLICAKAGVILEAALDFLTQQYECPVRRRLGGLYTLGDLLPAIEKKLRKLLRVELVSVDSAGNEIVTNVGLGPLLDELARIAQARNLFGAHFNQLSFELPDADAMLFGKTVFRLMELLVDAEAGWPRSNKSGSYWTNSSGSRRLYPLVNVT